VAPTAPRVISDRSLLASRCPSSPLQHFIPSARDRFAGAAPCTHPLQPWYAKHAPSRGTGSSGSVAAASDAASRAHGHGAVVPRLVGRWNADGRRWRCEGDGAATSSLARSRIGVVGAEQRAGPAKAAARRIVACCCCTVADGCGAVAEIEVADGLAGALAEHCNMLHEDGMGMGRGMALSECVGCAFERKRCKRLRRRGERWMVLVLLASRHSASLRGPYFEYAC